MTRGIAFKLLVAGAPAKVVTVVVAMALVSSGSARTLEASEGIVSECAPTVVPHYSPRKIAGPDDLSPAVRAALLQHLAERLGPEFSARLVPAGGQEVVPEDFTRANPGRALPSFTYELTFSIVLSKDGPVQHCARILLDAAGGVVEEIPLPACARAPDKCRVIGLGEALKAAGEIGVPVADADVKVDYAKELDALEYVFEYTVSAASTERKAIALHMRADNPARTSWQEVEVPKEVPR